MIIPRIATIFAATLGAACAPSAPSRPDAATAAIDTATITDVEWRLLDLHQSPAPLGSGDRRVTLLLSSQDGRVTGFGGCNRYAGTYRRSGDTLQFSQVMMTRMGCDKGMDLEISYTRLLDSITNWRTTNGGLELLAGDSVVARFERGAAVVPEKKSSDSSAVVDTRPHAGLPSARSSTKS